MTAAETNKSEVREGERIAKVMARAGLCSRRDAEAWVAEGRVSVNGEVLTSPAFNVSDADDVRVDGVPLRDPERTRLFFFHKPRGLVTTARDPEGRQTIFDALPPDLPRVVAIGRLDINTEGLLLLTNDGGLARVLELPTTGWLRRYRVRAHGEITQAQLDALREGVTIEGVDYRGIEARLERQQGSNVWLMMGLREGKNREIKRVLEHLGLSVNRLIRVSFGPFELGELEEGAVAELNTRILRDQLGIALAKQAGANFDAPIETRKPAEAPAPEARGRSDSRAGRPPAGARGERALFRKGAVKPGDRAAIAAELASRGERKETKNPRKRKHVSILRAEARAEAAGPRTRIERGATADRRGREVKVERIVKAREPEPAPERASRPFRAAAKTAEGDSRPARSGPRREHAGQRDGAPSRDKRPFRSAPRSAEGGAREGRSERPGSKREFAGKRDGAPAGDKRPFRAAPRSAEGGAREGRFERSGPKREFAGRRDGAPARVGRVFGEGGRDEGPRRDAPAGEERGRGGPGRPPSRGGAGGKPFGKRPPRKS